MENTQIKCCKKCGETKLLIEFQKSFNKSYGKYYYNNCKKCHREYSIKYKKEINPEAYKKAKQKDRLNKKEKYKEYNKNYQKNRRETDDLFYLSGKQRSIIYRAFKNRDLLNKEDVEKIIGLCLKDFREYLLSTKPENLNERECHIDHIIPLKVAFDIEGYTIKQVITVEKIL